MRLRFCCNCGNKEKPQTVENPGNHTTPNESPPRTPIVPLTPIITQQPQQLLDPPPIQLDKITEVSVEESSVVQAIEKDQTPSNPSAVDLKQVPSNPAETNQLTPNQDQSKDEINHENSAEVIEIEGQQYLARNAAEKKVFTKFRDLLLADKTIENQSAPSPSPPPPQPKQSVNQRSNIDIITTIDGDKLVINQMGTDLYRGTFKHSLFYIFEGNIQDSGGALTESDRTAIKHVYNEALKAMQYGMKEMSGGHSAMKDHEAWNPPPGSAINTNFTTHSGKNAVMTFKYIGPGHLKSTYEGKDFVILNGKLLVDAGFTNSDKQLIMQTYTKTMEGMQQGLLSMQSMKCQITQNGGENTDDSSKTYASYNVGIGRETSRGRQTLKRGKKRTNLLESEMVNQQRVANTTVENRNISQIKNITPIVKENDDDDDDENDDDGLWKIPNQEPLYGPWTSVGFDNPVREINPKFFFPDT